MSIGSPLHTFSDGQAFSRTRQGLLGGVLHLYPGLAEN